MRERTGTVQGEGAERPERAMPGDIRRLALVALYQIDSRGGEDLDDVRASLDDTDRYTDDGPLFDAPAPDLRPRDRDRAFELAVAAYEDRAAADAAFEALAPDWPARRQPVLDRAVLRLAHHEIAAGVTPPKVAADQAIELAKAFGGEKSPSFVAGLIGKVCDAALARAAAEPEAAVTPATTPPAGEP